MLIHLLVLFLLTLFSPLSSIGYVFIDRWGGCSYPLSMCPIGLNVVTTVGHNRIEQAVQPPDLWWIRSKVLSSGQLPISQ